MSYGICTLPTVQAVGEKLENRDTEKCYIGSSFGFVLVLKERSLHCTQYLTVHGDCVLRVVGFMKSALYEMPLFSD